MSKKNKIKIKKFILYFLLIGAVITFCATILSIILPVILGYDEAVIEKIFKRYIIPPYICVALPFVICFELWGNVLAHGAKALQYNTKFNNFERLKSYLKSNLLEHDYSMITSIIKDDTESIVYVRELKETFAHKLTSCRKQVEFYIIVKMSEITKEFRKNVDLELFKLMSKYYGKSVVTEGFYVNCDAELAMRCFEM